jgi:hypothetical protein
VALACHVFEGSQKVAVVPSSPLCPDYPQLPEFLQLVDVPLHGTDGHSKGGCKRLEAGESVVGPTKGNVRHDPIGAKVL